MYNPMERSQIGANTFATITGVKAAQNGADGWQALNVGLWWRWWYKNVTFSFFLMAVVTLISVQEHGALLWLFPAQCLVNTFVFGVTYVSLIDISVGFKERLAYRLFAPIQHAMPNVARFYWYCLMLLPLWIAMWQEILFLANNVGPWWFNTHHQWSPEDVQGWPGG
jgi:hypothetical protein